MKKYVFRRLLLLSLLLIICCTALSTLLYLRSIRSAVKSNLEKTAHLLASFSEEDDFTERLKGTDDMRITLIEADGTVLYDSYGTVELENHLSRPEVQEALASGSGYAVRISEVSEYETHYYALLLANGRILRTAVLSSGIFVFFRGTIYLMPVLTVAVIGVALLLSKLLTKRFIAPIEELGENLNNPEAVKPYPELVPFVERLQSENDANRHMEQLRREFTANVSHELKTPLTGISGYAEMIETGLAKPDDVKTFAGRIRTESARLLDLIGDIIGLSELDTLSEESEHERVNLFEVSKSVVNSLSCSAENRSVSLSVCGGDAFILGSRNRLEELIYNLADNGIRYNKPGGSVVIRTEAAANGILLTVSDTGIGIPKDSQSRVFERFYRVDKGRSKKSGGTGLGLAIVKHIAMLYNAEISLKSEENIGTVITVCFPEKSEA